VRVNRIIDYEPPENEEEVVHRTLAMVHYKLDEVFSSRGSSQNLRSRKQQFPMVGEDTIIDGRRLEAGESTQADPKESGARNKGGLPPPPGIVPQEDLPLQNAAAGAVVPPKPPVPKQKPATTPKPGDIRRGAPASESVRTRERVATVTSSSLSHAPTSSEGDTNGDFPVRSRSWSFRLFIFLFAVLIGSVSGAIFYFLKVQ
jgi:hypothetical protein